MAVGDYGSSNNAGGSNKTPEYNYYSRLHFKNPDEKKGLNVNFGGGLLKLEITEVTDGFKQDSKITIYLSQTKCAMLEHQLNEFEAMLASGKIDEKKGFGINAGMAEKTTYIVFHALKDSTIVITIGKFDTNGVIIESYDYTFAKDYCFSLSWKDYTKNDLDKVYDNMQEYNLLKTTILDFGHYMNGVLGYSVHDTGRYDYARMINKFDSVYDKLGIERSYNNGSRNYTQNSFLTNSGSAPKRTSSIDDIDSDIFGD
jgi:hypothetical protein